MSAPARITEAEACEDGNCNDLPYANTTAFAPPIPPPSPLPPMVEVTSPSNLREGYTFDALHNGQIFSVIVPSGGVKSGQTFQVPFVPNNNNNNDNVVQVEQVEAVAVPYDDDQFNGSSETTCYHVQYQHHHHNSTNTNNTTLRLIIIIIVSLFQRIMYHWVFGVQNYVIVVQKDAVMHHVVMQHFFHSF